ncbi:hypothetical protein TRIATDRAFT_160052 [Trichoderma atroviride IMI 206040]|uniref:Uncharacterized protein n=1 Tax=Hypocrea atroviridis (strain ATCC 20476 / IMI 206040) TaxID=452589 RepID=G9NMA5_HYPAI|nr:uncharacterized protein TRIATDRAFT_160052 [Trichoderma atroviride IMI 206040]EHK48367.1 hypothetical protein TRIATDRAFT_160052 [Trichoderma atroviride IMI 206040]
MGPSFALAAIFYCCIHCIFLLSSLIFELLHPALQCCRALEQSENSLPWQGARDSGEVAQKSCTTSVSIHTV